MPADDLLAGLDPEQREVATALRGPVAVIAGAGTGKTRAITHRIAYGVATGVYAPNRVMALTFTSRAAAELRGRLRGLGAGGGAARTFHAAVLPGRKLPQNVSPEIALDLHRAYEDVKDARRQLDFEDVLLATVGMLE